MLWKYVFIMYWIEPVNINRKAIVEYWKENQE
jgi:hypothetical protein